MSKPVRPAAQDNQQPTEKYICRDAGTDVVRVEIVEVERDDSWSSDDDTDSVDVRFGARKPRRDLQETDRVTRDTIMPLREVDPADGGCFSHPGGPEAETGEQADHPIAIGPSTGLVVIGEVNQDPVKERATDSAGTESSDAEGNR